MSIKPRNGEAGKQPGAPGALSERLLAGLPEACRLACADPQGLGERLAALVEAARAAWPGVDLPTPAFLEDLARRLSTETDPWAALPALRTSDLYLAWACIRGVPGAVDLFDTRLMGGISAVVRQAGATEVVLEEVRQTLRCQLFVARGDLPPLLCTYSGRGSLRTWLRSIAVRTAYKLNIKARKEITSEESLILRERSPGSDPELATLKGTYSADFRAAFAEAMGALSPRDRNLLRQHFVDGLSIDDLAPLYRVHRATAARWLSKARTALSAQVFGILRKRLRVGQTELESLVRLVRSQLDLHLSHWK